MFLFFKVFDHNSRILFDEDHFADGYFGKFCTLGLAATILKWDDKLNCIASKITRHIKEPIYEVISLKIRHINFLLNILMNLYMSLHKSIRKNSLCNLTLDLQIACSYTSNHCQTTVRVNRTQQCRLFLYFQRQMKQIRCTKIWIWHQYRVQSLKHSAPTAKFYIILL